MDDGCDSSSEGGDMFLISARIPFRRVSIACDVDHSWYPIDEAAFDRYSHGVPVKQLKQVRDFELRSTEIVEDDAFLTVVAVKPL